MLGSKLFNIYSLAIGDIIEKHNIQYHLYVDDNKDYWSVKGVHDLICSTFKRMYLIDIFRLMLSDLKMHIYYLKYILVEICLSFPNLYHIGIDHWLLCAYLTIEVR